MKQIEENKQQDTESAAEILGDTTTNLYDQKADLKIEKTANSHDTPADNFRIASKSNMEGASKNQMQSMLQVGPDMPEDFQIPFKSTPQHAHRLSSAYDKSLLMPDAPVYYQEDFDPWELTEE